MFAVSTKLPPKSRHSARIACDSEGLDPQPHSSPPVKTYSVKLFPRDPPLAEGQRSRRSASASATDVSPGCRRLRFVEKKRSWRSKLNALNDEAAIGGTSKSMLRSGLVRRAVVPSPGVFQRRKLGDRHTLGLRSLEHVLAAIGSQELDRPAFEARRRRLRVSIELGLVESAFSNENHIGRHVNLLELA